MPTPADLLKDAAVHATAREQYALTRLQAQLEFAAQLCEWHAAEAAAWRPLVERAQREAAAALAAGGAGAAAALAAGEAALAPLAAAAKSYTVHCVGHAHIDMNWMWSWPETVAVTVDSFRTVLKLMDEFPAFTFSQSQASVYRIVEQHDAQMLARIAARVREGRWEVTASHWVEGDKNLAAGESLCRHLLYTRRYLQTLFGLSPEDVPIDWSPDTFGHAVTIPSYLVRGGVKYLYLHRPGVHGPARPGAFTWQAPDGARVLVRNDMAFGYNGEIVPAPLLRSLRLMVGETGGRDTLFVYGVGDHGGGPTRRDLLATLDLATWPVFPAVKFSTARAFFDVLAKSADKLPVLTCELNTEFTGCYTTQTLIKKANRFAEKKLVDAEGAAALAWAGAGAVYPAAAFEQGWRDTLFSHFHDILPGSGVHDTRTYTHGLYQNVVAMTAQAEANAWRALAARVDTTAAGLPETPATPSLQLRTAQGAGVGYVSADGALSQADQSIGHGPRPFLVFNPCAWERTEVVEATVWDNARNWSRGDVARQPFAVRTPDGALVAAQTLDSGNFWGHTFVRVAFPARAPAGGYGAYTVLEQAAPAPTSGGAWQLGRTHHCPYARYERSPEGLANEHLKLELDDATGGIRALTHLATGQVVVRDAPVLEFGVERPHGMTAWVIDHTGPWERPELLGVTRRLQGPYKASLEVRLRVRASEFTLVYELRAGDPRLFVQVRGTWFERGTPQTGIPVLRVTLPLALTGTRASYEVPFGAVARNLCAGEEVPALRWAAVTGQGAAGAAGCVLYNDCKHGHALNGSTLHLTLIRSSYDPDPLPEIGQHEVNLALLPFAGELPTPAIIRGGRDFNHALRVVGTDVHAGNWPAAQSLLRVEPAGVILDAVKRAEDGDALVVRLHNPTDNDQRAHVTLAPALGKVVAAAALDVLERPAAGAGADDAIATVKGDTVTFPVAARSLATLRVRLARP